MSHFLIMWAPWLIIFGAISSLFIWGAKGNTNEN
ncbi:cytochrome bd oxidase small subunit CydS [Bacillus taeanensis]